MHSDVLDDLQKDKNFDKNLYPEVSDANSIKLIHIGEGVDGELYVYTYQPGNATKHYKAKYINMSLQSTSDPKLTYKLYSLTWLNSNGVFDKYLVNDFTILNDTYRYYTIAGIYRPYDANVDTSSDSETIDTVQYKSFPVAQTWCTYYYNNTLVYEMEEMKYVEYENLATGSVRYTEGFKLYTSKCDSHYVAVKMDLIDGAERYDIEKIYDIDITYTISNWTHTLYLSTGQDHWEPREGGGTYTKTLTEFDIGSNEGNGLLGKKYSWNRISTADEFISSAQDDANASFPQKELDALKQADFVFRICETEYESKTALLSKVTNYSTVSNIGILRVHFLSEGKVYNLGAVGDLVGTDSDPELEVGIGDNILNTIEEQAWWQKIMAVLLLILLIIVITNVFFPIARPIFKIIYKGIGALISIAFSILTFPLRLISKRKRK